MDIVKNIQIIRKDIENWPSLDDYRNENEDYIVAAEKLRKEIFISDAFFTVDGVDFFIYKYDRDTREKFERENRMNQLN